MTQSYIVMLLFDCLVNDALLESSSYFDQPLLQLYHVPDWGTLHRLLYLAQELVQDCWLAECQD